MVIQDLISRNLIINPGKTAVFFEGKKFTYREFNTRVNCITNALLDMGIKKGDRVSIITQNCNQSMEMYFAAAKGGMIICPVDFRLREREMSHVINHVAANTVIFGEEYTGIINSIQPQLKTIRNYICIGSANGEHKKNIYDYEDLIVSSSSEEPDVAVSDDDLFAILFTSGTTGLPKGVMLTHKNLLSISTNMVISLGIKPDDKNIVITPLFHGAAIWPMLTHFYMGATTGTMRTFDVKRLLELIQKEKITNFNSVPTIILRLLNYPHLKEYDLSSLRWVVYGGAPMPVELTHRALDIFGDLLLFTQIYGQTESFVAALLPQEDHYISDSEVKKRRLGSCGRQIINTEARVVSEDGNDVSPGQIGEIITRSDCVMKGYWKMPEETSKVIKNGWLYTGDLATVDDEGYIYILDRRKDMIISGGENIYSREVEEVIYTHPAVFECAVIGVPDDEWGESVKAIVALKEGEKISEHEIIDHCKTNLASFKKPKSVEFVESLPKTTSGKITKAKLRDKFWTGYDRKVH